MNDLKFCIDCEHCSRHTVGDLGPEYVCNHPLHKDANGKAKHTCREMRRDGVLDAGACGSLARLYKDMRA